MQSCVCQDTNVHCFPFQGTRKAKVGCWNHAFFPFPKNKNKRETRTRQIYVLKLIYLCTNSNTWYPHMWNIDMETHWLPGLLPISTYMVRDDTSVCSANKRDTPSSWTMYSLHEQCLRMVFHIACKHIDTETRKPFANLGTTQLKWRLYW